MTVDQNPNENPVNDDEIECVICSDDYPASEMHEHNTYPTWQSRRNNEPEVVLVCPSCAPYTVNCGDCQVPVHNSSTTDISYHHQVCESCYDNYGFCDECEEHFSYDDYSECPTCEELERERENELIHDYSYRPEPTFMIMRNNVAHNSWSEPRNTSVTGFELEMEAINCDVYDGATEAQSIFGDWCYLKHDGSLSNGFEMVSHPMSREFILEKFPWEKLRELSAMGMRSAQTRTCGLHIHINRSYFADNPTTMYRFMSMFYRNPDKWKVIAGRQESTYANWSEYELSQMLTYTKGFRSGARNGDRYVALNLQNRNTIELRFFKGTLRPQTFVARLEAAHAVAQYAHATRNNVSIKKAHDWERFREWTTQNGFTHFNAYATEKGI